MSVAHSAQFKIFCIMAKETTNTETRVETKVRYKRVIQGFMLSSESFASPKDLGVKINGDAIPYITSEGEETTTSVINVSSTQFLSAETNIDALIILSSLVMLNQAIDRQLINMLCNKAEITFVRELKDANYVPIGATEPLGRSAYITTVEKIEGTPHPAIVNMVMQRIANMDIYEKVTKVTKVAPVIEGIAPQIPE